MKDDTKIFNEQEMKALINRLQTEKDRHVQEKLAQEIQSTKDERTAALVAEILHAKDAFVRNIAIEILVGLNEKALPVLEATLLDQNRNIRKFAVDALKHIKGKNSCRIAMDALDDQDENVVEAALEVIAEHQFREAEDKLREILKKTNSVWIINSLFRTFERLDMNNHTGMMKDKIFSIEATNLEKNILMNTYVRTLGSIGTYQDIELILNHYAKDFMIDVSNLVFALSRLVIKNEISLLPEETIQGTATFLMTHWDYQDSSQVLDSIAAFVKLQQDFFLRDIKKAYQFWKGEAFFIDNIYELIQKLGKIPSSFVHEILTCEEPELVLMGLKLIHTKQFHGFNNIVEELCNCNDRQISSVAIHIIAEIHSYKNPLLLESLIELSEEAEVAAVESKCAEDPYALSYLLGRLDQKNKAVRKAAAKKLMFLFDSIDVELLEDMIRRHPEEGSMEALEVLYKFHSPIGWKHITSKMDCTNETVRAGLVDIMLHSSGESFYRFMETMLNDPSAVVRKRTIKALNKNIDNKSLMLLKKLYENESDIGNRVEIISNLYRFFHDDVINMVEDASYSSDILIRLAAVKALSFMNRHEVVHALDRLLNDRIEEVREAAKEALCTKRCPIGII